MTLLTAIVKGNQCVLSGDYRRTSVIDETEYYDDVEKVVRANKNILIGFSGDVFFSRIIGPKIFSLIKENFTVDDVAIEISKLLKDNAAPTTQQTIFIVGKGSDGEAAIIEVSHHNAFEFIKYKGEIHWRYSMSKVDPGELIRSNVYELDENIESLISFAKEVNHEVSQTDNWVSSKCKVVSLTV
ncbi:hypothetical protein CUC43_00480 [Bacillus thuringiensis LM1212]|uniref:hypothetical protein n=1 Tax=Bacillus cereus group TaxID=86661 RepID=UPI00042657E9|nr:MULTISPECIES: hypothetical protein [Bacillus cereus group]AXY05504.1 hypothetical protein CUC43_00480 [Bacillus thuringiensis LM1212]QDF23923.1 hypothetical protein FJR70_13190 [Bacillus tropicus]QUG97241.1 hypothetical protein HCM98_20815 [Bacillus tropicus]